MKIVKEHPSKGSTETKESKCIYLHFFSKSREYKIGFVSNLKSMKVNLYNTIFCKIERCEGFHIRFLWFIYSWRLKQGEWI